MAEVFEVEDSDFGGGSGHHGVVFFQRDGCSKHLASETGDHAAKPTEADQDQSR
jgi:hypothetical protein